MLVPGPGRGHTVHSCPLWLGSQPFQLSSEGQAKVSVTSGASADRAGGWGSTEGSLGPLMSRRGPCTWCRRGAGQAQGLGCPLGLPAPLAAGWACSVPQCLQCGGLLMDALWG